jgi:GNAT superfamily N-acetyltransferase
VGLASEAVVGYYTLAVGHVTREDAPERLTKGLARLALVHRWEGQGVGKALLKDAMLRFRGACEGR